MAQNMRIHWDLGQRPRPMIRGVRKGDNNMTFNKLTGLFLALTVFTMFSGCSRKEDTNWLIGKG